MDDGDAALFLIHRLKEQTHLEKKFANYCSKLGNAIVWDLMNLAIETKQVENKRTVGGYFIKLASKELSKQEVASEAEKIDMGTMAAPLRKYQQETVELATRNRGQNYVVNAPTGSGKTRIFVEISR